MTIKEKLEATYEEASKRANDTDNENRYVYEMIADLVEAIIERNY